MGLTLAKYVDENGHLSVEEPAFCLLEDENQLCTYTLDEIMDLALIEIRNSRRMPL